MVDAVDPPEGEPIIFRFTDDPESELMRIDRNGDFFVRGKLIEKDIEVYESLKLWLDVAGTKPLVDEIQILNSLVKRCLYRFRQIQGAAITKKVISQATAGIKLIEQIQRTDKKEGE